MRLFNDVMSEIQVELIRLSGLWTTAIRWMTNSTFVGLCECVSPRMWTKGLCQFNWRAPSLD